MKNELKKKLSKVEILEFCKSIGRRPSKNKNIACPHEIRLYWRMRGYCNPSHGTYDPKFAKTLRKFPIDQTYCRFKNLTAKEIYEKFKNESFNGMTDFQKKQGSYYSLLGRTGQFDKFKRLMKTRLKRNPSK